MSSANRAARRRAERARMKAARPVEVPRGGEYGVEVTKEDDSVILRLFQGPVVTQVHWHRSDAKMIGNMIVEACGEEVTEREIVRESGLVVPPAGIQLP